MSSNSVLFIKLFLSKFSLLPAVFVIIIVQQQSLLIAEDKPVEFKSSLIRYQIENTDKHENVIYLQYGNGFKKGSTGYANHSVDATKEIETRSRSILLDIFILKDDKYLPISVPKRELVYANVLVLSGVAKHELNTIADI